MPTAIPNGGGGEDTEPTTSEAAAYHSAVSIPSGERSAEEQQVVEEYEEKVEAIGETKADTGGPAAGVPGGGKKTDVSLEVAGMIGELEYRRKQLVDQWARDAARAGPGLRRAQSEMHGADTPTLVDIIWLLLEIRERLNDSPY